MANDHSWQEPGYTNPTSDLTASIRRSRLVSLASAGLSLATGYLGVSTVEVYGSRNLGFGGTLAALVFGVLAVERFGKMRLKQYDLDLWNANPERYILLERAQKNR